MALGKSNLAEITARPPHIIYVIKPNIRTQVHVGGF